MGLVAKAIYAAKFGDISSLESHIASLDSASTDTSFVDECRLIQEAMPCACQAGDAPVVKCLLRVFDRIHAQAPHVLQGVRDDVAVWRKSALAASHADVVSVLMASPLTTTSSADTWGCVRDAACADVLIEHGIPLDRSVFLCRD